MNSSSAFKQRSGARTQRKSADKGEREVFIQSAGGGAAEDSTFARDYAREAAAKKKKRSWADVVRGEKNDKGPEASFTQSANAAREQEKAAASAAGSEIKPPPRAFTYAEVVSGKQQLAKKNLLDEEEQARAAFAALASSRARVDLDLSRIADDNDATLLIDQGKGGDVAEGANDGREENRDGVEDGRFQEEHDRDEHDRDEHDRDEQDLDGNEQDHENLKDGLGGDNRVADGGDDSNSFIWDKKARRADERRRREEERSQIATKAARKLEDLERRLQEEEAAKREASALRKRNRDKSPRASSQTRGPAEGSGALELRSDGTNNTTVKTKTPPPFPVFVRGQQRKALAKANAKEAKKAKKSQRSEGPPQQDSISDRQRTPADERRFVEPPSDDGQNKGDGSRQRRDADGGEGDRRVRQRDDTEVPAAASSRRERRALDKSVRASNSDCEKGASGSQRAARQQHLRLCSTFVSHTSMTCHSVTVTVTVTVMVTLSHTVSCHSHSVTAVTVGQSECLAMCE